MKAFCEIKLKIKNTSHIVLYKVPIVRHKAAIMKNNFIIKDMFWSFYFS